MTCAPACTGTCLAEARLVNLRNQIQAPDQIIATGSARFADQGLTLDNQSSHAIYSRFSWEGG